MAKRGRKRSDRRHTKQVQHSEVGVKLNAESLEDVVEALRAVPGKLKPALVRATKEGAKLIKEKARANAPYGDSTGRLRDSIQVRRTTKKLSGKTISKGSVGHTVAAGMHGKKHTAFYGLFVEYGTRWQPADAFMRFAAYSEAGAVVKEFEKQLQKAVADMDEG